MFVCVCVCKILIFINYLLTTDDIVGSVYVFFIRYIESDVATTVTVHAH